MRKRIRRAGKYGFSCHAERFDRSIQYCMAQIANDTPRAVILQSADTNGRPLNHYYVHDEEYLRTHKWEDSPSYKYLMNDPLTRPVANDSIVTGRDWEQECARLNEEAQQQAQPRHKGRGRSTASSAGKGAHKGRGRKARPHSQGRDEYRREDQWNLWPSSSGTVGLFPSRQRFARSRA